MDRSSDEPVDTSPPADQEPAAHQGGEDLIPAGEVETAHACQPPRESPPDAGSRWRCPECGRIWLLKDISSSDEGGPGQTVAWEAAS
jgi:hypothetical protein